MTKSKSTERKSVKRSTNRKDYNVSSLARIAMQKIIGDFDSLPWWAQKELLTALNGKYQDLVTQWEARATVTADKGAKMATGKPEATSASIPASKSGDTATVESASKPSADSNRKLQGFDRPIVRELACADRLRKLSVKERQSAKEDLSTLSSALAAVGRGVACHTPESEIREKLLYCRESAKNFLRLWPSKATIRSYSIEKLLKGGHPTSAPRCYHAGDVYVIRTHIKAPLEGNTDSDGGKHKKPPVLSTVPFHSTKKTAAPLSRGLVQSFLRSEKKNYDALKSLIHNQDGSYWLYWLTFDLSGTRWGSEDDEMSISASTPTARSKKRKKSIQIDTTCSTDA
jgi:hypothetical protein